MTVSPEQFRDALRHFAAGVTVVTAGRGADAHGMTVSAFTSVSMEPPLIAVVINSVNTIHPLLAEEGAPMAVSFLAEEHEELSERFAYIKDEDRFALGAWTTASTGAPVLADAVAWLDCTVEARYAAGTHVIYVGRVVASQTARPGVRPLIYWDRGYRRLDSV